ncbi:hypothetical protein [Hydrogenophaga sp. BPS33]|uniref:hypothetical protein n=1 Tax=Hydrogenophaga sp. BPS33 TaxID=2651974 RepID=UPI0013204DAF|nr:hypothetical protein [Hydrogenophaga sp. BPS33]QHE88075.1 hypothetical protein F9K07_25865 [Hydrogenophaga sp. BPS33]
MNTPTNSWAPRLALALRHFFQRAAAGASDGLEAHLSTATSLHELENMQRQWDRARRGQRFYGAL